MHITGERRVPAPRERVWRCLADPAVLQECITGSRIGSDGNSLMLSVGASDADAARMQMRAQPSIREPFTTLGWRIDPAGAATQMVLVRLTEQGVFTLMHYEISLADRDGDNADIRAENLRARIDQALDRLVHTVAGTGEIAAGGIAGAVQAVTEPSAQPNARIVTAKPEAGHAASGGLAGKAFAITGLMTPSVIGGVLFLLVLLFMTGLL